MDIDKAILAAGIVLPLRNPDAEKCAQDIAAVIYNPSARQAVFDAFHKTRPDLKQWEVQAIKDRVLCIAKTDKPYFDSKWKNVPMPEDFTCSCGLYVHPLKRDWTAIHINDCFYHIKL